MCFNYVMLEGTPSREYSEVASIIQGNSEGKHLKNATERWETKEEK